MPYTTGLSTPIKLQLKRNTVKPFSRFVLNFIIVLKYIKLGK